MRLRHFSTSLLLGALVLASGRGAALAAPATDSTAHVLPQTIADEVVAVVGNSQILLSDLEEATNETVRARAMTGTITDRPARDEALENLLIVKLLSEQARADSLDKELPGGLEAQIEAQIQQLVLEAGSVKALEKRFRKEIYAIKDDLKKAAEDMQLASLMQSDVMKKVTVTYAEVADFFGKVPLDSMELIPEQYVYAQIVRLPPATEERKFEVRQRLLEFRRRILAGEKLGALARLYSMDPGTARSGGEWGPGDANQLVYPIVEALENLKPGMVSEVIETEYGYHIVELISRRDNLLHFRQILLKPQFTVEETERELKLLDSLAREIGTDKKAFEEAVGLYSMDAQTNRNGGVVFNAKEARENFDTKYANPRYMKDALDPMDYRALSRLQPGEVSAPFETIDRANGNTLYKIVRLNEVIPTHAASLAQDYEIIEDVALQDKQNRTLDKWLNEMIGKMYVWIAPEYRGLQFERKWIRE
ncbi:peptidylprolyl isomerase [uncultured Rikenella sp.]|uniref:peptidylprolyl isomerase n=1 Tax=uncultured Rikenella sp. TaxID=368003 RepID=UPI00261CE5C1|nr:peptidylprolyl isomerase [uncultured Rikenella sp.]